jgi:nitrate/nitrite transport system substrate-binding protein
MVTALSLDLNGNAVTVSQGLYRRMLELDPEAMAGRPVTARALRRVIEDRRRRGDGPLTFAMVFPVSTHNYELRYWMAAAGIDPDRDLRLVVVPPSQMVGSLKAGRIDGCCVGEPWNGVAVREGVGRVLITGYEIWNNNPEKVFGVNLEWAEQHPRTHRALVGALLEAARWLDAPENRPEVVELIARGVYVNAPPDVVRMSMTGTFQYARTEFPRSLPDFNVFHRYAANFPWRSHAVWLMTQMLRWGQIDRPLDLRETADRVCQPDLYRAAARDLGIPAPTVDHKTEGGRARGWTLAGAQGSIAMGPDLFLDGGRFSPADPLAYLDGFAVARVSVDREALGAANPPWSIEQRSAALAPEGGVRTGTA